MASFSTLPIELRLEILRYVIESPLPPPFTPNDVEDSKWIHLTYVDKRYKVSTPLDDMAVHFDRIPLSRAWINSSLPWDCPHLALLLVSKSFKVDTEAILETPHALHMHPIFDLFISDGALFGTWLRLPPSPQRETDTWEINVRSHRAIQVSSQAACAVVADVYWDCFSPNTLQIYLLRILGVGHYHYRQIGLGKGNTHVKTIRLNFCTPPPELGIHVLHDSNLDFGDGKGTRMVQLHPWELARNFSRRWAKKYRHQNVTSTYNVLEVFVDGVWCFRVRSDSAPFEGAELKVETNKKYQPFMTEI